VHEVHALPVDVCSELRQGVQLALAGPPVEIVVPVGDEFAQVVRVGAGPLMVNGDGSDGEDMKAPL
jgi:hypothetical protein